MTDRRGGDTVGAGETITDVKVGYVGGASQGWAHVLINDLAQCADLAGTVALYDVEYEPAATNAELGNRVMDRDDAVGDWSFEAHREMADALRGADVVICSTQDPPGETFVHDIDVPKEYGVYQTVADTVGPGGAFRSLRAVPQYRRIAATVREECPDAWVINYTNPMTVCTRTLYEEYPGINAIGLCHEVAGTKDWLAGLVEEHVSDAGDVSGEDVDATVKGINHFTWIDAARWCGHDLFAFLDRELSGRKPLPRFEPGHLEGESYYVNHHDVALDLYDTFGLLGAAGDRHLVEFVPWYLDVDDPAAVERWGIRLTPSSARVEDDDGPTRADRYLSGEEEWEFRDSGEVTVDVIRALLGGEPFTTNVNYPNVGQTPDLADCAVVETDAVVTTDSVSPIASGKFPSEVRSLVERTVANQETYVRAGVEGDLDLAFRAFLNEPLMTIQRDAAREMFADLVEVERPYLREYDLDSADVLR